MSAHKPQRGKPAKVPQVPAGYRSTRRGSKSLKSAKRAERADKMVTGWNRFTLTVKNVGYVIAMGLGGLLALAVALLLIATLVNGIARWNSERRTARVSQPASAANLMAQENLLVIGVENGKAVGFLAVRVNGTDKQAFGVAIPDGAFIEVPGQGFERVGESYAASAGISLAAVSNYLTVPFKYYVVVPASVYQQALANQQVSGVAAAIQETNLTDEQRAQLSATLASVPAKSTALVPLPVKPIKLGTQTYYEPQRDEVADLLKAWWGIDPAAAADVTRVILYNGAGKPGIAGLAAQDLIRGGFRVIDTKNADRFNYKTTLVIVERGPLLKGNDVVKVLGTGQVMNKPSDQDVTDIIVIIGKDYKPSK